MVDTMGSVHLNMGMVLRCGGSITYYIRVDKKDPYAPP